jgi:hypothetical protein
MTVESGPRYGKRDHSCSVLQICEFSMRRRSGYNDNSQHAFRHKQLLFQQWELLLESSAPIRREEPPGDGGVGEQRYYVQHTAQFKPTRRIVLRGR